MEGPDRIITTRVSNKDEEDYDSYGGCDGLVTQVLI